MPHSRLYRALTLVLIVLLASCSTKKNRWLNRTYHSVTTKFNIYFNGKESLKEGIQKIHDNHQDDYTQILPIYIYGDDVVSKTIYPEMDRAIKKGQKGITKHSMLIKKKERNKWIDDCYMLIGKAHFYKKDFYPGIETLEYVAKAWNKKPVRFDAFFWLVRTHLEMEKYDEAVKILDLIKTEKDFPEDKKQEYQTLYADYYIRLQNYSLAITELKEAIALTQKKKQQRRLKFILAQLYHELGDNPKATYYYTEVLKMNPAYEMEFYCKINRALAYDVTSGRSSEIRAELKKLLRDEKNEDFYDQIYYALAELELKQAKLNKAIEYLVLSTQVSTNNKNQKGKSFLKLAELHYDMKKYPLAQAYYDSTTTSLDTKHPDYAEILAVRNNLTRLVKDLLIIEREDSLQALAGMSRKARNEIIADIIEKVIDQEEEQRQDEENQKLLQKQAGLSNTTKGTTATTQGGWYFSNPSALNFGFNEFKKIWGERKNEDHWRRKDKSASPYGNAGNDFEFEQLDEEDDTSNAITDIKSYEFYEKNIPTTDEKMVASHNKIIEAAYDLGLVYQDRLEDSEEAIIAFEDLLDRYDTNRYVVNSCYHLYKLHLDEGNDERAAYYKNKIIREFPLSDYAKILQDPNYYKEIQKANNAVKEYYEATYKMFKLRSYSRTLSMCNKTDTIFPNSELTPKFDLLRAMAIMEIGNRPAFKEALQSIVKEFPKTPEANKAKEILNAMGTSAKDPQVYAEKEQPLYVLNETANHHFVLIVPSKGANVNQLKINISDFNAKYFSLTELEVTSVMLGNNQRMISIKKFPGMEQSMDYYDSFNQNTDLLKGVNDKGYQTFSISNENYATFFKEKKVQEYASFFERNYLSE